MFDFLPILKAVILRFCSPDFLSPVFCRLTPGVSQEDMTQFYDMTWFYDMTLVLVVEAHLGPGHSPTLSLTYYIPWLGPFQKCQSQVHPFLWSAGFKIHGLGGEKYPLFLMCFSQVDRMNLIG